jgi:hypothetical protein
MIHNAASDPSQNWPSFTNTRVVRNPATKELKVISDRFDHYNNYSLIPYSQ